MDQHITLIITGEAGTYSEPFNVHQTIGHIIRKALKYFGIDENLYHQFEIVWDETILQNSESIDKLGFNENDQLFLRNKGPLSDGSQTNA